MGMYKSLERDIFSNNNTFYKTKTYHVLTDFYFYFFRFTFASLDFFRDFFTNLIRTNGKRTFGLNVPNTLFVLKMM